MATVGGDTYPYLFVARHTLMLYGQEALMDENRSSPFSVAIVVAFRSSPGLVKHFKPYAYTCQLMAGDYFVVQALVHRGDLRKLLSLCGAYFCSCRQHGFKEWLDSRPLRCDWLYSSLSMAYEKTCAVSHGIDSFSQRQHH